MKFLSKRQLFILIASLTLVAAIIVPVAVFAEEDDDANRLSGGNTLATAGEFDESLFGERLHLKDHMGHNEGFYVKLPELFPGQGLKLELFNNVGKQIKILNGVTSEIDGTIETDAEIVDENLDEICGVDTSSSKKTDSCLVDARSSEEDSYQFYLHINALNYSSVEYKTHKDIGIEVTLKEQYDSAVEDGDAPNKIQNALQIEPGEHTGWVSTSDKDDFYKIVGLSDGATLTIRVEAEREGSSTTSNVVGFYVFDDDRKKIGGGNYVPNNAINEKEYSISVPAVAEGELENKATRYIQVFTNSYDRNTNEFYSLSIEATGYTSSSGSGGDTNCSGFQDLSSSDNRCAAVTEMKRRGIMNGKGDGSTFGGSEYLTRAALCAVILKFKGVEPYSNNELGDLANFIDVSDADKGKWWVGIMRKAKEIGIISGFPDNSLRPADPTNRAQFFLILAKAKNATVTAPTTSPANDVSATGSTGAWYRNYVKFALDNDLVDLDHNRNFFPNQSMMRYDVADSIYRWFQNIGE